MASSAPSSTTSAPATGQAPCVSPGCDAGDEHLHPRGKPDRRHRNVRNADQRAEERVQQTKPIHLAASTPGGRVLVVPAFDRITNHNRAARQLDHDKARARSGSARGRGRGPGRPPGSGVVTTTPTTSEAKELMAVCGSSGGLQGVLWLTANMPLILKRNIDQPLHRGARHNRPRPTHRRRQVHRPRPGPCAAHPMGDEAARVCHCPGRGSAVCGAARPRARRVPHRL